MSNYEHPYTEHADHLEFVVPKDARDEAFFNDMLQAMVAATEQTGKRKIFIDRSLADQSQPVEPMAIYRLSLRMAEAFGARVRIGALTARAEDDSFWEDVATNRGAIVKASNDRENLLAWLLENR